MNKAKMLVTGGAGFIGSHMCEGLLAAGHEVVVVDNPEAADNRAMVGCKYC